MMYSALAYLLPLVLTTLFTSIVPPVLSSPMPSLKERYYPQGTISAPANGTAIQPGESFDFFYNTHSDYCLSSMNFSVWLYSSPPEDMLTGLLNGGDVSGWYFGRYAYSSSSDEYPSNPAPSQLTMPDFSQSMGGFSIGESVSNATMYLAVMEEYNECAPTVGHQMSLTANQIVYNTTGTSTSTTTTA